jgi:hypothetical protein
MDITRRKAIALMGAASTVATVPLREAAAASGKRPSAELLALGDKVQALVDRFDPTPILAGGQYRQIFEHVRANANGLEDGQSSQVGDVTWHVKHVDTQLGLIIEPGHLDDIDEILAQLVGAFQQHREISAAKVLDSACVCDPTAGGDGRPLCSVRFAGAHSTWSNAVVGNLDGAGVEELERCLKGFVDEDGLRIVAKAVRLVVPVSRIIDAELLSISKPKVFPRPYLVADYLQDANAWFVLTGIPGLVWSERKPFSLRVEIDADDQRVVVVGHEKRGFGCLNPRAFVRGARA